MYYNKKFFKKKERFPKGLDPDEALEYVKAHPKNKHPEAAVIKKLKKLLPLKGIHVVDKTWGNIYERPGRADLSCIETETGIRVEVEAKTKEGTPSELQLAFLQEIAINKGISIITYGNEETLLSPWNCACGKLNSGGDWCIYCGGKR